MILFEYFVLIASLRACLLGLPKSAGEIWTRSWMVVCKIVSGSYTENEGRKTCENEHGGGLTVVMLVVTFGVEKEVCCYLVILRCGE
jgi:hypothetical protein